MVNAKNSAARRKLRTSRARSGESRGARNKTKLDPIALEIQWKRLVQLRSVNAPASKLH